MSLEKWELWQCIAKGFGEQHCHSFCHIPACSAAEESPGTAAGPPGLLWHCWALSGAVQAPAVPLAE